MVDSQIAVGRAKRQRSLQPVLPELLIHLLFLRHESCARCHAFPSLSSRKRPASLEPRPNAPSTQCAVGSRAVAVAAGAERGGQGQGRARASNDPGSAVAAGAECGRVVRVQGCWASLRRWGPAVVAGVKLVGWNPRCRRRLERPGSSPRSCSDGAFERRPRAAASSDLTSPSSASLQEGGGGPETPWGRCEGAFVRPGAVLGRWRESSGDRGQWLGRVLWRAEGPRAGPGSFGVAIPVRLE